MAAKPDNPALLRGMYRHLLRAADAHRGIRAGGKIRDAIQHDFRSPRPPGLGEQDVVARVAGTWEFLLRVQAERGPERKILRHIVHVHDEEERRMKKGGGSDKVKKLRALSDIAAQRCWADQIRRLNDDLGIFLR